MPPYLSGRKPWFVFLVHPRGTEDLDRYESMRFLRHYSDSEEEFLAKAYSMPPLVAAQLVFDSSPVTGELISILRSPESMTSPKAREDVLEAFDVAVSRGTRVVGLGALTSPASGAGQTLLEYAPKGLTITTGNAYTAAVVRQNVLEASEALALGKDARVAVVGCTGSVGSAASHLLAEAGFRLILVGRTAKRASHLLQELAERATFTGDLGSLANADIVILLTSDSTALVQPDMVSPGAVIIDCAQPANVPAQRYADFAARGVRVVEGGIVQVPQFQCAYDFGFSGRHETFACMAETFLFAREGILEHSVGRASPDLARRVERLAAKRGISPRPLGLAPSWESPVDERDQLRAAAVGTAG